MPTLLGLDPTQWMIVLGVLYVIGAIIKLTIRR